MFSCTYLTVGYICHIWVTVTSFMGTPNVMKVLYIIGINYYMGVLILMQATNLDQFQLIVFALMWIVASSRVAGKRSRVLCDRQWRRGSSSAHLLCHEKSEAVKQLKMNDFLNKLQPAGPSYTTSQILSLTALDTNANSLLQISNADVCSQFSPLHDHHNHLLHHCFQLSPCII